MENILYVGTDRGVYVSTDRGDSWSALQGGLPNVPVHDLVVHPRERELVAGTHGRSIWIVDVLPLQDLVEAGSDTALEVFYVDEVQADRGWRSERSRWYFRPDEAPASTIQYWSDQAGAVSIEITDKNGSVVRRLSGEATKGMNSLDWDLLVDEELALTAETSAPEQAGDEVADAEEAKTANMAEMPYAESIRLGHALYAIPGDYTVRVTVSGNSDSTGLKIKTPKDYEPRFKESYKIRGKES
jgi:hypothetical protein